MRFAEALQQQVEILRQLIKEQNEFIKHFETRQDKAIKNWTYNNKQ
jgi:flagellar biosynthesis chaperone FliJ